MHVHVQHWQWHNWKYKDHWNHNKDNNKNEHDKDPGNDNKKTIKTLRPRQNGRHFPDDTYICFSLSENVWILIKISLKFVPKGPINYIPTLVEIMAWRRPGDKPLSEPMMINVLTNICVTRLQWIKIIMLPIQKTQNTSTRFWKTIATASNIAYVWSGSSNKFS